MSYSAVYKAVAGAQPQFDVEAPLSIDNAYDVFEAMYEARDKWRNIGGAFRVPDSTLSCIAQEEDSADDRLYRVIKAWLENGGGTSACTWSVVAETLKKKTVGREHIAREVEEKYLKQIPQASSQDVASGQIVAVHLPPQASQDEASVHVGSQQGSDTALQCCITDPFPSHPSPPFMLSQHVPLKGSGAPEMPSLSGSSHDPVPVLPQTSQSDASVHVSPQPQPQATETTSEFNMNRQ